MFLGSSLAFGQDDEKGWQWIKRGGATNTMPGSNQKEGVYQIRTDSQQNIYMVSSVSQNDIDIDGNPKDYYGGPNSRIDFALASFDCEGNYRWSKIIGGGGRTTPFNRNF